MDITAATVSFGHVQGTDSDRGVVLHPPGPQATLDECDVCDVAAGSRDHDASNPAPVSSRTRRKLMLQHREDDEVEDELDDGDDSEASSDEEVYYQTVAVGGRSGRHGVGGGATIHV